MARLADYFVVLGYDHERERNGVSCGKVIQRFPTTDWEDTPFIEGIELFCQPEGWFLSVERQEPRFFVSVLTDIDANRHYCACLSFNEPVTITPSQPVDEEEEESVEVDGPSSLGGNILMGIVSAPPMRQADLFAPKCLVLVSRHDYFDTFKNCLGIIYAAYIDNMSVRLESLVGNVLGCVQVPPSGGPQVRFSIGAGDRQALQPPIHSSLPVTNSSVATLFQQLGIQNTLKLFCAVMTEHKILFHSLSYTRLTEASRAITALMFPFRYTHVYIPILPAKILDMRCSPTPFIMGVHSSHKNDLTELLDIIIADLDGGSVTTPDPVSIPSLPEPLHSNVHASLSMVLHPELGTSDHAFPPSRCEPSPLEVLDKEVRAIFLRMFAILLQGYRSCLTIIRIHAKPVITFNKDKFLEQRGLSECQFSNCLVDSMYFTGFVSDRGAPWRVCDVWDERYNTVHEWLHNEEQKPSLVLQNVKELSMQLWSNENPSPQPYVQKIPQPTDGAFTRTHLPTFPQLNVSLTNEIIVDGMQKHSLKERFSNLKAAQPRVVSMGPSLVPLRDPRTLIANSTRRLEVLRSCVNFIFENKLADARKTFPAVMRALKSKPARLSLCEELSHHVMSSKAMLEHQQFDLVTRLMNCALKDDCYHCDFSVAAAMLPLASAFCRKLSSNVNQFAYTIIQDHPVWNNQQFWEAAFYQDVQKEIRALYLPEVEKRNHFSYPHLGQRRSSTTAQPEPSALEIAAEQLRAWHTFHEDAQKEAIANEEKIVFSQAIHYAHRMMYLKVPLDVHATKEERYRAPSDAHSFSNSAPPSVTDSASLGAESGVGMEETTGDVSSQVIRFIGRFLDHVCTEGGVSEVHINQLHHMLPVSIASHMEYLEEVHREHRRLPRIHKPKIMAPSLLNGEEVIRAGMRAYLIPDGREEGTGLSLGGPALIPAEGALFLTNYRLIFKGTPCDPFASEHVVVRSFPVMALTKEKKVTVHYLAHIDQWLQEGLQLRSNTFQLLKVAFDEEVSSESIEVLRKELHKRRYPFTPLSVFAFVDQCPTIQVPITKDKGKHATLAGMAKKTMLRTTRKLGLKPRGAAKRQVYHFPTGFGNRTMTSPGRMSLPRGDDSNENIADILDGDFPIMDRSEVGSMVGVTVGNISPDIHTLEKLMKSSVYWDYKRLELASLPNENGGPKPECWFKITTVNVHYSVTRSYPALLVVPISVSDSSLTRLCRCYRHSRFPAITWRHPKTKGLLLRAAGYHNKSVMALLNRPSAPQSTGAPTDTSVEQEKLLSAIVAATPMYLGRHATLTAADSTMSVDSLVLSAVTTNSDPFFSLTPESGRRSHNPFSRAMSNLRDQTIFRTSGGKSGGTMGNSVGRGSFGRWGSIKGGRGGGSQGSLNASNHRYSSDSETSVDNINAFHTRSALYVFGEKSQIKGVKAESYPKCDFIPVDYLEVRHVKQAFKKLMRACVPSTPTSDPELSFYRAVEESNWLKQLQSIMQISGAIVDLIDVQGSSVMLCLEDGWDLTAQVSSVAQLCLDPYYRTMEGFRVLIEKEWLAFGHRFSRRHNHSEVSQASGFAPVFLQFLDVVHQILTQFPLSFEFNQFYVKFLAYHSVSCRFRTFLLDSELDRLEAGIVHADSAPRHKAYHRHFSFDSDTESQGGNRHCPSGNTTIGMSVFDYIEMHNAKSAVFYNFLYTSDFENAVLRPFSSTSRLQIWDYFITEELAHGPSYDLEVLQLDSQTQEETEAADGRQNTAELTTLTQGYDNELTLKQDMFLNLMEDIYRLESELGHLPQQWRQLWDRLELPCSGSLPRQASLHTQMIRWHGRSCHKRSTLELLVRGKLGGSGPSTNPVAVSTQPHQHRFSKYSYTTPIYCDYCSQLLWGLVKTGSGFRCMDCGYNCHEKCMESVAANCTKLKPTADTDGGSPGPIQNKTIGDPPQVPSVTVTKSDTAYWPAPVAEHRSHEGYLWKRGALLKAWKQRWFVLDSVKHQMRYYDSMDDSHCKGYMDLQDVQDVTLAQPSPGAPKKVDDKSFFDVRTNRRVYNFCAVNATSASEWMEKIQACLQ